MFADIGGTIQYTLGQEIPVQVGHPKLFTNMLQLFPYTLLSGDFSKTDTSAGPNIFRLCEFCGDIYF